MVNLPLIIFSLILFVYAIVGSLIWYHLAKFGVGFSPKLVLIVFIVGSIVLISLSIIFFLKVPWGDVVLNFIQNNGF